MSGQPVETEIKLRVPDPATARRLLSGAGFEVALPRIFEANNVYDRPDGELRAKGCLLRLRLAGELSTLTFKGAPLPGPHKSRPEIEVPVGDFAACDSILRQLGYEVRFRYEKYRTEFRRPGEKGAVLLDETPIGVFLELEGDPSWIDQVAAQLGSSNASYITSSYIALYFEQCRAEGSPPGDMVFRREP